MSIDELTRHYTDLQHQLEQLKSEFNVLIRSNTDGNGLKLQEQVTIDDFRTLYNETIDINILQTEPKNEVKNLETLVKRNSENISSIHENMVFGEPKLELMMV